ncbi:MAG: PTS sugar transporter subunit IIA [Planktotalea sp.]|uniref:PTS sugar transporter subunit IIA n=1 Tax=Planktotalea sp. TaxID=2029877 RepID=UPI003C714E2B
MDIHALLKPEAVKFVTTVSSKKMLLHAVADLAAQAHGLDAPTVLRALMDREALGPTAVGHGVALPHARIVGLDEVKTVFIRLEKPIEFDAVDRKPVDLFFGLLAPENAGVDHLKALALISRTMRETTICATLRANDDVETLHTIITENQRQQAA